MNNILGSMLSVAGVILFAGCGQHKEKEVIELGEAEILTVDSVRTECIINAFGMKVIGDSLLIVANNGRDTIFDAFSTATLQHLNSGGVVGPGPGQLLYPDLMRIRVFDDTTLTVPTAMPSDLAAVDSRTLEVADIYEYAMPEGCEFLQEILPLAENKVLMQCAGRTPYWAIVDKKGAENAHFEIHVPEPLATAVKDDEIESLKSHVAFPVKSDRQKKFAIVNRGFPHVGIYDFKGNQTFSGTIEGNVTNLDSWILGVEATDDAIFVRYNNAAQPDLTKSTILKFNWDGELMKTYEIPRLIGAFTVGGSDDTLYFVSYPENEFIYRCRL